MLPTFRLFLKSVDKEFWGSWYGRRYGQIVT